MLRFGSQYRSAQGTYQRVEGIAVIGRKKRRLRGPEAWEWLLRKELKLESKEPNWIRLPAMMRMAMTSPNVMKTDRPEWLAPFNFFLFPLLSDLGGYPPGFDRSTFRFIAPPETNRKRWKNL